MKVIFDNNLSHFISEALSLLLQHYEDKKYKITSVKGHFGKGNIPDVELLAALGKEQDWVFISGDNNIRRRPTELEAFKTAGLVGFFLSPRVKGWPVTKQMAHLLNLWEEIEDKVSHARKGSMFTINTNGIEKLK